MEELTTQQFGLVRYDPEQVIRTPAGLPAFEDQRRFVLLEDAENAPLVFIQSLDDPDLAFVALPATVLVSDYRPTLSDDDRRVLDWNGPAIVGPDDGLLCLAIVTVGQDQRATANLMAPVVLNLGNRIAVQAIQLEGFSHQHPVGNPPQEGPC